MSSMALLFGAVMTSIEAGTMAAITALPWTTIAIGVGQTLMVASAGLTVIGAATGDKGLMDAAFWTGIGGGALSLGGGLASALGEASATAGLDASTSTAVNSGADSVLPHAASFEGGNVIGGVSGSLAPGGVSGGLSGGLSAGLTPTTESLIAGAGQNVLPQASTLATTGGLITNPSLGLQTAIDSAITPTLSSTVGSSGVTSGLSNAMSGAFNSQLGSVGSLGEIGSASNLGLSNLGQQGIGSSASILGDLTQSNIGGFSSLGGNAGNVLNQAAPTITGATVPTSSSNGLLSWLTGSGGNAANAASNSSGGFLNSQWFPPLAMGAMQGISGMANSMNQEDMFNQKLKQQQKGWINSPGTFVNKWATA